MLLSKALLAMKARLLWAAERLDTFSNMSVLKRNIQIKNNKKALKKNPR